jgi:hypothetical protein
MDAPSMGHHDVAWRCLCAAVERLNEQHAGSGLTVSAQRTWSLWRWRVSDRIHLGDNWADVVEVV